MSNKTPYNYSAFFDDAGNKKDIGTVSAEIDEKFSDNPDLADSLKRQIYEQYYQVGPDLNTFETMLNKLTGSKMKQQGQIAAARRGDIYAGGLANMMSNF